MENINQNIKIKIKETLKTSLRKFFENKEVKTSHVLDYIFPVERRIRSLIGVLETSMGTTFWEPIAKILAEANGFKIIEEKILSPDPFPQELRQELDRLINERETKKISTEYCIQELRKAAYQSKIEILQYKKPPSGTGVDIHLLSKDGIEYVFDTKTTQPNVGDFKKFNKQLLEWYAYRFGQNPQAQFKAHIAIPFNPFEKDWYKYQKFKISPPLDQDQDIWVEDEFWDFCSGETNTWHSIEQIFIELGEENFGQEFKEIFEQK